MPFVQIKDCVIIFLPIFAELYIKVIEYPSQNIRGTRFFKGILCAVIIDHRWFITNGDVPLKTTIAKDVENSGEFPIFCASTSPFVINHL